MSLEESDGLWLHLLSARRQFIREQTGHFLLPDEPCQDPACSYQRWYDTPLWICVVCCRSHFCTAVYPPEVASRLKESVWVDPDTDPCHYFLAEDGRSVCVYSMRLAMHIEPEYVQAGNYDEHMEQAERLRHQPLDGDHDEDGWLDTAGEANDFRGALMRGDQEARARASESFSTAVRLNRGHRKADRYAKWEQDAIAETHRLLGLQLDANSDEIKEGEEPTPPAAAPMGPEEELEEAELPPTLRRRRRRRRPGQRARMDRPTGRIYSQRDLMLWDHLLNPPEEVVAATAATPSSPIHVFPSINALTVFPLPTAACPLATVVCQYIWRRKYESTGRFYARAFDYPMSTLVPYEWMAEAHQLLTQVCALPPEMADDLVDLLGRWHALIRITSPSFVLDFVEMLAAYAWVLSQAEGGSGLIRRDGRGRDLRIVLPLTDERILNLFIVVEGRDGTRATLDTRTCILEFLRQTHQQQQLQRQTQSPARTRYILLRPAAPAEAAQVVLQPAQPRKFTLTRLQAVSKKMAALKVMDHFHFNAVWLDDWFNHPSRHCWPASPVIEATPS